MKVCIAVLLVSALGCTSSSTPVEVNEPKAVRVHDDTVRAQTGGDSVVVTIVATFTNTTTDTLHLHPCRQQPPFPLAFGVERREQGVWKSAWAQVCTHALMLEPPRLLPGASRVDTLRLWASRDPNTFPQWSGPISGTYRLVYGSVYSRWYGGNTPADIADGSNALGTPAADSVVSSASFQIIQ